MQMLIPSNEKEGKYLQISKRGQCYHTKFNYLNKNMFDITKKIGFTFIISRLY